MTWRGPSPPPEIGDRVIYSGFYGDRQGRVLDITRYGDGSPFEFVLRIETAGGPITISTKPRQVRRPCPMCAPYDRPGWIVNANELIKCFDCNQNEE